MEFHRRNKGTNIYCLYRATCDLVKSTFPNNNKIIMIMK